MSADIGKMFRRTNRLFSFLGVKCSLCLPPSTSRASPVKVLIKPSPDPVLGGSHVPSRKAEQFYHDCNHPPQLLSGIFTHFS